MMMSQLSMSKRYQLEGQVRDDMRLSSQVLEQGNDHNVSFAGTSQFTTLGVSACGLAAFNFARIAFRIEHDKKTLPDVLNELGTREIVEEIVAICAGWSSDVHLEVDDIHNLPVFNRSLKLSSIEYGRPQPKHFQTLLENMKKIEKSSVMIITRPPEIIACFKFTDLQSTTPYNPVFVIFDSHPRPSHPQGACLSFSTSIESTARALSDILPALDESIFNASDFQWQAQLLAACSAHVYVGKNRRKDLEAAMIRSSLAVLDLRAHISQLERENKKLDSDNKQLETETNRLRTSIRQEQAKTKHEAPASWSGFASRFSFGLISHDTAGPSRTFGAPKRSVESPPTAAAKFVRPTFPSPSLGTSGAQSIFANNPPPVPSEMPPSYEEVELKNNVDADSDDPWIQSANLALQLQNEFDSEDRQLRHEHAHLAQQLRDERDWQLRQDHGRFTYPSRQKFNSRDWQSRPERAHPPWQKHNVGGQQLRQERTPLTYTPQKSFDSRRQEQARLASQLQNEFDAEDRRLRQEQVHIALQLQNEFDAEDRQLRREQAELALHVQATFQCSICMDELPEDDVAKVDGCAHTMCRSCLRGYVSSKIQEHRYPIFCPMCTIDGKNKNQPRVISRPMIEQVGVSEEQSQILTEMELAEFTIQIHCRRCQRPAFVDREDYAEVFNIVCPQSDCHHVWCKKCEQAIIVDGPKHSCDGSSELDHLMKEKGWQHCPNCKTPILKESGCNHMTCISPGCNSHFCYICGEMIVRSALNHEIGQAVSTHFRKCQLFEVPN